MENIRISLVNWIQDIIEGKTFVAQIAKYRKLYIDGLNILKRSNIRRIE